MTLTWKFLFHSLARNFFLLFSDEGINYEFSFLWIPFGCRRMKKSVSPPLTHKHFTISRGCFQFPNFQALFCVRQSLLMIDIWINSSALSFFQRKIAYDTRQVLIKMSWWRLNPRRGEVIAIGDDHLKELFDCFLNLWIVGKRALPWKFFGITKFLRNTKKFVVKSYKWKLGKNDSN